MNHKFTFNLRFHSAKLALAFVGLLFGNTASASLISVGVVPSSGNGIGAVNTSLTFQHTGIETGCVAFNGTAPITGCTAGGVTGENETTGSGNNVFTAADLGFGATRNFTNLVVIFDGNEGGGPNQPITLTHLALTLYSATGESLATFTTAAGALPVEVAAFPGQGSAGIGFALDTADAALANSLLASNPNLRIGTAARATGADGGPETVQLTTVENTGIGGSSVPEPSTYGLLSGGLFTLFLGSRRRKTS